jgi:branched-chain amino acid transport system permease protein
MSRALSSEVDTGSRQENRANQKSPTPFPFNQNGKASRRVLLIAAVAIVAALPLTFGSFWINMVITALIFSLAVFSINLLTGLTGLLSFGQAGFVGIGAYTLGVLAKQGYPPALAGFYGVLLAMLCGFLLGLPAARLKGHYLAIGTLGFGILIYQLLTNSVDITRGPMGLVGIPTGGIDKQTWYLIMLSLCLAMLAALTYIDRYSALGVVLKMVRHDEIAAQASGINTFAVKLIAFTASAGLAGLSGVLFAAYVRFLTPDLFNEQESFRYMMMAVVGGIGSPFGGVISSVMLTMIPEGLRVLGEDNYRLLVYGTMVLFVLWFLPSGIGGLIERLRK